MGDALYRYLKPYYEQGIDAVIVQDAGVLKFISEEFPGLSIHASTQMSLAMAEGVACFSDYPVTRLVNARELGLFEIQRIRKQCGLEIESFVHGALCYCYSGQCLMSSMIGGRSGNRGRCAQPCRLAYNGAYLLSPKDICTLDMIPELIGAGIDSFKILSALDNEKFEDFEDCLQEECAVAIAADYIITRNIKDFSSSRIPAILPDEFLKKYQ